MKLIFDFFPVALFFIVYKTSGLYVAIYVMIAATFLQMMIARLMSGKFEKIHLLTFGLLLVFGGITLLVRDPAFVMWKVSVLYVLFALVIISSLWLGNKPLLQRMLGKELHLPDKVWRQLTWFWGLGFVIVAVINSYYVEAALSARTALFANSKLDPAATLSDFKCAAINVEQLCLNAQQTENAWVNFKLFGTMGLTFILLLISVIFISKYIKQQK